MIESVSFTAEPIHTPPLELPSREIGAVVEFLGVVREMERGAPLQGLYYEAYEAMARKEFSRIFSELQFQNPIAAVTLIHRTGWVAVGEPSLYIRVLASHRAEAFAFCHRAIDRMKEDVPIWKITAAPPQSRPA